ncbi:MAG: hypothetical protein E7163_05765 [Firmicutes bacterium]|nr:hypothetical protein [Bacillota bacterium]
MEIGYNKNVRYILSFIGIENVELIEAYIENILRQEFVDFSSEEDITKVLEEYANSYTGKLALNEIETIRSYTGFRFRELNAVLRNNWNYEINGKLTDEIRREYLSLSEDIKQIIAKTTDLPTNIKTYRGVSIDAFSGYGIRKINDLKYLEGKYLYESGFTSTSLVEKNCFFYNQSDWGTKSNILIEYLVPSSDDGIWLNNDLLSYSASQNEFLINSASLFKVLNVEVNNLDDTVKMQVMLIPKKMWNKVDYEIQKNNVNDSLKR